MPSTILEDLLCHYENSLWYKSSADSHFNTLIADLLFVISYRFENGSKAPLAVIIYESQLATNSEELHNRLKQHYQTMETLMASQARIILRTELLRDLHEAVDIVLGNLNAERNKPPCRHINLLIEHMIVK